MTLVSFTLKDAYPKGVLFWIVSGNRQTQQVWTDGVSCKVDVIPGPVSVTVYARGSFDTIGTTLFLVEQRDADDPPPEPVSRRLLLQPAGTTKTSIACQALDSAYVVKKYDANTPMPRCTLQQLEVTWPESVCLGHGVASLRGAVVSVDGVRTLVERWCSYARFAKFLSLQGEHAADNDTLLPVTLGLCGGCYHHEKYDDRGPAGLTCCQQDDCDGMAYSSVVFWNMLLSNRAQVELILPSGPEKELFVWAAARYPTAFVVFGQSCNPDTRKKFYHAWAALEARPLAMYQTNTELTEAQRAAVVALGVTEWNEGAHLPQRNKAWSALTDAERTHLNTLGYNKLMWSATPKLHIESTSPLAFSTKGTVPSKTVTQRQKEYRATDLFSKKRRRLLFSCIRQAPTEFDAYIDIDGLYGAHYAYTFRPIKYTTWLASDDMYPRMPKDCCDKGCQSVHANLAPVILRSANEAAGLPMPRHVPIGKVPRHLHGELIVVTDWDHANPPHPTKAWSVQVFRADHENVWAIWSPARSPFVDLGLALCDMCSARS